MNQDYLQFRAHEASDNLTDWFKRIWKKKFPRFLLVLGGLIGLVSVLRLAWPAPYVQVTTAVRKDVVRLVVASGQLRSTQQTAISAQISGTVQTLLVDVGDRVKQHQKLARISSSDLYFRVRQTQTAVSTAQRMLRQVQRGPLPSERKQALANLQLAQSRLKEARQQRTRIRALAKGGSSTQADLDRAEAAAAQANAQVAAARAAHQRLKQLPRPEDVAVAQSRLLEAKAALRLIRDQAHKQWIRAPYEGIIIDKRSAVGQLVAPGNPLYVIASTKHLEVYAETDENNLPQLRVGQEAIVVPSAFKQRTFPATLYRINPVIDTQRGVVGLRLKPKRIPKGLLLNMTVDANIQVSRWPNAFALPISTLIKRKGSPYVMTVKDKHASLTPITLRGKNTQYIVVQNISPTTPVILKPHTIEPGKAVRTKRLFRRKPKNPPARRTP